MKTTESGLKLIKEFEGCRLNAYPDPASGGAPFTIGFGNTFHPDGTPVKLGDKITKEQANEYLTIIIKKYETAVNELVKSNINQQMFNALVSFTYNLGAGNLQKSTLLKKVNINPNDQTIADEFVLWLSKNPKMRNGLLKRRKAEVALYFS
jgi:lysozyme